MISPAQNAGYVGTGLHEKKQKMSSVFLEIKHSEWPMKEICTVSFPILLHFYTKEQLLSIGGR